MTPRTRCSAVIALIICTALPSWGQQYLLYTPQPVTPSESTLPQDGILVHEVEIQKGDTLYKLSRKFNGNGMYYPQILLFNSIKNPDLIYQGKKLKVPLVRKGALISDEMSSGATRKRALSAEKAYPLKEGTESSASQMSGTSPAPALGTELSLSELKPEKQEKSKSTRLKKRTPVLAKKSQSQNLPISTGTLSMPSAGHKSTVVPTDDSATGSKLFEAAVKSYRQDDCRTALELLDRYLADNSGSPLAADANLYKAECYMKLSAQ